MAKVTGPGIGRSAGDPLILEPGILPDPTEAMRNQIRNHDGVPVVCRRRVHPGSSLSVTWREFAVNSDVSELWNEQASTYRFRGVHNRGRDVSSPATGDVLVTPNGHWERYGTTGVTGWFNLSAPDGWLDVYDSEDDANHDVDGINLVAVFDGKMQLVDAYTAAEATHVTYVWRVETAILQDKGRVITNLASVSQLGNFSVGATGWSTREITLSTGISELDDTDDLEIWLRAQDSDDAAGRRFHWMPIRLRGAIIKSLDNVATALSDTSYVIGGNNQWIAHEIYRNNGNNINNYGHGTLWVGRNDDKLVIVADTNQQGPERPQVDVWRIEYKAANADLETAAQSSGGGLTYDDFVTADFTLALNAHSSQFTGTIVENVLTFNSVLKTAIDRIELAFRYQTRYEVPITITRAMLDRIGASDDSYPSSPANNTIIQCAFFHGAHTTGSVQTWPVIRPTYWQIDTLRQNNVNTLQIFFSDNADGDEWTAIRILCSSAQTMVLTYGQVVAAA